MYTEDQLLQLSGLQHLLYCERQCALIHVEQLWVENLYTAQGRTMHEKAHEETSEKSKDLRIERGLGLHSLKLGLTGKGDVVEFHRQGKEWIPYPVEYKRGKAKPDDCDRVQLCAQALCLEEMTGVTIYKGAVFYGKVRRREEVTFKADLKEKTIKAANRFHEIMDKGITPQPVYIEKKCNNCSLIELCLPTSLGKHTKVESYLKRMLVN